MNFLSGESFKRLDQYFKFIGQISTYKQFSYLSFFVNQKGDKLQYNQDLNFAPLYRVSKKHKIRTQRTPADFLSNNTWTQSIFHSFIENVY